MENVKQCEITHRILLNVSWLDDTTRKPDRVASLSAHVNQNLLSRLMKVKSEMIFQIKLR